jgi:gluconate 2-dehydrogenase alpha chain
MIPVYGKPTEFLYLDPQGQINNSDQYAVSAGLGGRYLLQDRGILGAYVFNNVLLMLTSGIGQPYDPVTGRGVVGKNYCYQYTDAGVSVFFEDKENNPFMATGAFGTIIDDFNGDNFDHGPLGFLGGGHISAGMSNGRPIGTRATPPGTPRWGKEWKQETAKWYRRWFNVSGTACNTRTANHLDLDPTAKDALGRPDPHHVHFKENDRDQIQPEIGGDCTATSTMVTEPLPRRQYSLPYQSTHNTGGTTRARSLTSVVNRYLQAWMHTFINMGVHLPQNRATTDRRWRAPPGRRMRSRAST